MLNMKFEIVVGSRQHLPALIGTRGAKEKRRVSHSAYLNFEVKINLQPHRHTHTHTHRHTDTHTDTNTEMHSQGHTYR